MAWECVCSNCARRSNPWPCPARLAAAPGKGSTKPVVPRHASSTCSPAPLRASRSVTIYVVGGDENTAGLMWRLRAHAHPSQYAWLAPVDINATVPARFMFIGAWLSSLNAVCFTSSSLCLLPPPPPLSTFRALSGSNREWPEACFCVIWLTTSSAWVYVQDCEVQYFGGIQPLSTPSALTPDYPLLGPESQPPTHHVSRGVCGLPGLGTSKAAQTPGGSQP